jgi:transposase
VRARTEKQLAYERRRRQERTRKQKRAAKLLGQGMTQQAVAAELGVTTRTLRNWKAAPVFQRERERHRRRRTVGTGSRRTTQRR